MADQLISAGVPFAYEKLKLPIEHPPRTARYTPDITIDGTNIVIECKGYWYDSAADRQKMVYAQQQHPEKDFRFIFQDASKPIYKGSRTSYGKWATDHNFKYSDKGVVPKAWLDEIVQQQSASGRRSRSSKMTAKRVGSGKRQ